MWLTVKPRGDKCVTRQHPPSGSERYEAKSKRSSGKRKLIKRFLSKCIKKQRQSLIERFPPKYSKCEERGWRTRQCPPSFRLSWPSVLPQVFSSFYYLHSYADRAHCVMRAPLLYFIRSWVAYLSTASLSVCQASVTPVQISTFCNI